MTATCVGLNSEFLDLKSISRQITSSGDEHSQCDKELEQFSARAETKQLKEIVRNNHWSINNPIRKQLWSVLCNQISSESHEDFYKDVSKDLFGEQYVACSLPAFVDPAYCIRYHLSPEGRKKVEKILQVIHHIKPEITYCPVLYPLVSLFLHFMSEEMTFSCVYKLILERQNYICQTKSSHMSSAYLVSKLTKKFAKSAYTQLQKELKEHEDFESMFQNWQSWIFKGLPFSYLVRVIDCFLLDKMKSLYRIVLAVLILYSKNTDKAVDEEQGMMQKLLDFCQNIPVPVEKLFKIAYGIRGFSEKLVNQYLLKAEMVIKSQSHLGERSQSADLPTSDSTYHLQLTASHQPVIKELKMDASNRTRSLGVVALGNFKSEILTSEQMGTIWGWLPLRISMLQPEVIYSTNEHGVCLTAFYIKCGSYEPTIIVIKAMNDEVFGAFCSSSWNSRHSLNEENKKMMYFGTGETFLFTLSPEARKYPWVGCSATEDVPHAAKLFMAADSHMITVGAGNGQAILLDEHLLNGRTDHCDSFNNDPLCSEKDFTCKIIEVIAFK